MNNNSKILTPRAIEMYGLIERYLENGQKQKDFCNQHDLKPATFQKWLYLYRKDKRTTKQKRSHSNSEFIPIKINSAAKKISHRSGFTIEYPNGIILRMAGDIDVSVIQTLLR